MVSLASLDGPSFEVRLCRVKARTEDPGKWIAFGLVWIVLFGVYICCVLFGGLFLGYGFVSLGGVKPCLSKC